ncbi:bifunctional 2',3'-cyclic-nucleotide 2'-phosphodiesterase/3'-nucleotidase [Streptococcus himalayensis]|uniref:2',3'-cyclic-nucleotide 2'-phosphodiesterase n=1 Tax=Streptococcus himalayensis TaxID=1888195 RepID=A0A917EFH1_9STRE|nr:bifunctional 2',3'-cyclic-nucleotide 2'-phosphodiesterase/3'-nucleotidase [Streptococcus himalayensis]GGE36305.1 2',3'-cyclic-nucleotide 2'-phosphodiesterase [Streptococcus himalayensis]
MKQKFMLQSTLALTAFAAVFTQQQLTYANEQEQPITIGAGQHTPITLDAPNIDNPAAPTITNVNTSDVKPIEGQTVDVRILATTDLHTNLVNYDYYQDKPVETLGLAKTALLIEEAKKENPNTVLVDNGDTIQGTPLGTYKSIVKPIENGEEHPMYVALNALGYDIGTLGNHEFNYGLDYLNKVIASAKMPIVNANVLDAQTGEFIYEPYKILEKAFIDTEGRKTLVKIGVTGIVPPQIMLWDKANLEGKVIVRDAVDAVKDMIPVLRKAGADIVLVLSHSGIGDDIYEHGEENVGYQIASLPGVDAVVTGHSHAEFPSGNGSGFYEKYKGVDGIEGKINGTPVTMAGKYGDHLGIIDLNLTYTAGKWNVNTSKGQIRKIDTKSAAADKTILDLAKEAHEGTVTYVRQQVGTTTAPITSYFALVKDDPSVQIVNNAQLWYAKQELAGTPEANLPLLSAAAPFKAGTRNDPTAYTNIPAGPIAIKNVADLYLYDNVTAIVKVTGAQLKEWLEMSAGQFNTIDPHATQPQNLINTEYRTYNFDVIDGVTYRIDVTQPNKYDRNGKIVHETANRIVNLEYQGKAIDPNQEFIVVTNNYRSNGTFPGVKDASLKRLLNLENRQAIINYILAQKEINPRANQNWYFADTIKGLDLRFMTANSAKEFSSNLEDVSYLEPSSIEGFGTYRFTYVEPTIQVEEPNLPPLAPTTPIIEKEIKEEISLPNGQKVTLPVSKIVQPQSKTSLPATSISKNSRSDKGKLPNTGTSTSPLGLFGLATLALASLGLKKGNHSKD